MPELVGKGVIIHSTTGICLVAFITGYVQLMPGDQRVNQDTYAAQGS